MPRPHSSPGQLQRQPESVGQLARLVILGDWTLQHYAVLKREVEHTAAPLDGEAVDLDGLGELDTAGAGLLVELLGVQRVTELQAASRLPAERLALLQLVASALDAPPAPLDPKTSGLADVLADVGSAVLNLWNQQKALLGFIGLTLQTLFITFWRPRRWRLTSLVAHIERTGLDAVPIVALLTFLVGAVVAFLGAT